jgi:hypothetical protein
VPASICTGCHRRRQVKTFLSDTAPDAWERLIDSLRPHRGTARSGDATGSTWFATGTRLVSSKTLYAGSRRYRDYVIKSLNDDKRDKFVKEQLAGDELWPDDPEARTGTGYSRVSKPGHAVQVEELNAVEKLTDAVDTTSAVFSGLTTGCTPLPLTTSSIPFRSAISPHAGDLRGGQ